MVTPLRGELLTIKAALYKKALYLLFVAFSVLTLSDGRLGVKPPPAILRDFFVTETTGEG